MMAKLIVFAIIVVFCEVSYNYAAFTGTTGCYVGKSSGTVSPSTTGSCSSNPTEMIGCLKATDTATGVSTYSCLSTDGIPTGTAFEGTGATCTNPTCSITKQSTCSTTLIADQCICSGDSVISATELRGTGAECGTDGACEITEESMCTSAEIQAHCVCTDDEAAALDNAPFEAEGTGGNAATCNTLTCEPTQGSCTKAEIESHCSCDTGSRVGTAFSPTTVATCSADGCTITAQTSCTKTDIESHCACTDYSSCSEYLAAHPSTSTTTYTCCESALCNTAASAFSSMQLSLFALIGFTVLSIQKLQ